MDLEMNRVRIKRENLETGRDLLERTKEGLTGLDRFSGSSVRIKKEEEFARVCEELKETINEKEVIISEQFKKIMEMKDDFLKNGPLCNEKLKGFETREARMSKEIEELKLQKLEADRIIEKLRARLSESEETENGLRAENMEARVAIEQLSHQNLAAEAHLVKYVETLKQMGQKQLETDHVVVELKRQLIEIEAAAREKYDNAIEEMQRKLLEGDCTVKELRETVEGLRRQNFAAYKAAQVFKKKYDELVPLAVGLRELLNAKIEGVVNVENNVHFAQERDNTNLAIEINDSDNEDEVSPIKENINIDDQNPEPRSKTWRCGAHMLDAFEEDDELCMNAVCALYRHQVSTRESLCHFVMMGGRDLAKCLIDGDPELRLKKPVSEIKRQFPNAINECRILARSYYEKLYMLYCSGKDRFFRPM
ncbi:hypothetical protein ABFX02_01G065900 [Erythranthe guttata]